MNPLCCAVQRVLDAALDASPAHALMAQAQRNTFALHVNGRRCPVTRVAASAAADEQDPFKAHAAAPAPLAGTASEYTAVECIERALPPGPPPVMSAEGRVPMLIPGESVLLDAGGVIATTVTLRVGNVFRMTCDERTAGSAADGSLRGGLEPVDTHVFLHAEEPDAVMQNLLEVAENTCYLHSALRSVLPGKVVLALNP